MAVRRLPATAAEAFVKARDNATLARRALERSHSTGTVLRRTVTADDAYAVLLREQRAGTQPVDTRWIAGPSRYALVGPDRVRAVPTGTDRYAWGAQTSLDGTGTGFVTAPATGHDLGFRRFTEHVASYPSRGKGFVPLYDVVGTFDPNRLADALNANAAPLNPFHRPGAPAADPATAPWLRGGTLAPDGNMAGYLIPPPALLTTIEAGSVFSDAGVYGHETAAQAGAPISVIRVRVGGVTGPDPVSRERLRVTAETIAKRTGLQVDVVSGASPTGGHRRPAGVAPGPSRGRAARELDEEGRGHRDPRRGRPQVLDPVPVGVGRLRAVLRQRDGGRGPHARDRAGGAGLRRLAPAATVRLHVDRGRAGRRGGGHRRDARGAAGRRVLGLPVRARGPRWRSRARPSSRCWPRRPGGAGRAQRPAGRGAPGGAHAALGPGVRSVRGLALRNLLRVPGRTVLGVVVAGRRRGGVDRRCWR